MVSRVRVWLNRTYAENVFFMDQLRRNPSDRAVEIHATHGDPDSPVLAAADTAELEPENLSPAGYVEYARTRTSPRDHIRATGSKSGPGPWLENSFTRALHDGARRSRMIWPNTTATDFPLAGAVWCPSIFLPGHGLLSPAREP